MLQPVPVAGLSASSPRLWKPPHMGEQANKLCFTVAGDAGPKVPIRTFGNWGGGPHDPVHRDTRCCGSRTTPAPRQLKSTSALFPRAQLAFQVNGKGCAAKPARD